MKPMTPTLLQAVTALRYLRAARENVQMNITVLELKMKEHGDGISSGAILALAAEVKILDDYIAQLWQSVT